MPTTTSNLDELPPELRRMILIEMLTVIEESASERPPQWDSITYLRYAYNTLVILTEFFGNAECTRPFQTAREHLQARQHEILRQAQEQKKVHGEPAYSVKMSVGRQVTSLGYHERILKGMLAINEGMSRLTACYLLVRHADLIGSAPCKAFGNFFYSMLKSCPVCWRKQRAGGR